MFTKRNALEVIESVFNGGEVTNREDVLNYIAKEFAALDHKNEKARERAAERKANGDALRAALKEMVTDEPVTVKELVDRINQGADKEVTTSMVIARMSQLVKAGEVEKVQVKSDGRKLVGYILN